MPEGRRPGTLWSRRAEREGSTDFGAPFTLFTYRITKYDPSRRDASGAFTEPDWTSMSDVGKAIRGEVLSPERYLATEDSYVAYILWFFDRPGLAHLRMTGVETANLGENLKKSMRDPKTFDPRFLTIAPEEDGILLRADIAAVCRMVLREIFWCRLEVAERFFVHFGWDYYVYVGSPVPWDGSADIHPIPLFVGECPSPHGRPADRVPEFHLSVFDKITGTCLGDIPVDGSSLEKVRRVLGVSAEHPAYGIFDLDGDRRIRFEAEFDMALDGDRFCYELNAT
ncbi:DUF7683 domain-containing protein [Jiella sonneratiae]|uniref:DUF7683 domain-containing protein n=1 Tax=Jiella sonneratiae TaxID=2816856 RepID=A0ABS3J7D0_9HYPH|nr:hypothetical protein [Jiella sonneratiae]MBO0905547.1 hypothetical protein [Jiella sonneratiae]